MFHLITSYSDLGRSFKVVEHLVECCLGWYADICLCRKLEGTQVTFYLGWWVCLGFARILPFLLRHTIGVVAVGSRKYIEWIDVLQR
jgi:hypothetical protein